MTTKQEQRLEQISQLVFDFIMDLEDDAHKADASMSIIFQALCAGESHFDDHRWLLNESGKTFRKFRKEVMIEEGTWDEYSKSVIK